MFARTGRKLVGECSMGLRRFHGVERSRALECLSSSFTTSRPQTHYTARALSTTIDVGAETKGTFASSPTQEPEPEFASGTTVNLKEAKKFQEVADLWYATFRRTATRKTFAC